MRPVLLGVLSCVAGCGLTLDYDPPDPRAPDGGTIGGGDAGGPGPVVDAATPDGGGMDSGGIVVVDASMESDAGPPVPLACGGPSFVQDHFDDATRPFWGVAETLGGGTAGNSGGRAVFTVPPDVPGAVAGYGSFQFYDAREDSIAAAVFPARLVPPGGEIVLALVHDDDDFTAVFLNNNRMSFVVVEAGVRSAVSSIAPYDAIADRWWRVGGRGGDVHFETSPDGATWSPLGSLPAPPFLEAVRVVIGVRARSALTAELAASFEDLGRAPSSVRQLPCPIDSYRDDFTGELRRLRWSRVGEEKACEVGRDDATGSLSIRPVSGACGIATRHAYDAENRWLTLEVARGPSSPEYGVDVVLSRPAGSVILGCRGISGSLLDGMFSAGFTCSSVRFWRLGHFGGEWIVEATDDRSGWTRLASIPATIDPSRVTATLIARPTASMTTIDDSLLLATYNP